MFGFTSLAMWGIEEGTQTLGFALYQLSKSDLDKVVIDGYLVRADSMLKALDHASIVLCCINPVLRVWALPYMNVVKFQFEIYKETMK